MMRRGYTLVEIIIVLGISTLILLAIVNLFIVFNTIYGYQQAFIATAGSNGTAMNALEAAILPADLVLASHDFSGIPYASGVTTLVLQLPAIDVSGNIITDTKDYVAFYTSSGSLFRITAAGVGSVRVSGLKKLSTTLNSLTFTYDNADFAQVTNITADITTQTSYKQQVVQSHLSRQWYLRNFQPSL